MSLWYLRTMFRATFFGWQGWMFESESARLLVDPLLTESVGRGPAVTRQRFMFWPPREWEGTALPRLDAVFLSHEHEDHFNVPTLARLDRRIPLWLSARASRAARTLLADLGFQVTLVYPGEALRVGDLELRVFTPDLRQSEVVDEWDTLAYLVHHPEGRFFTNVDVAMTPAMVSALQAAVGEGDCLSYVGMELGLGAGDLAPRPEEMHRPSESAAFLRGGDALEALRQGRRIRPLAGQVGVFVGGRLAALEDGTAFLRTAPAGTWPEQPGYWPARGAPLEPLLGPREFDEALLDELEAELGRLAGFLYGRPLFRELYSLSKEDLAGREPTFALLLLSGEGEAYVYAYRPEACGFELLDDADGLEERFMGVVACWASDLLAAFRGVFEPRGMVRSLRESWRPVIRGRFFMHALWPYLHPLRHPERCLAQYRALAAEEAGAPLVARARERG